MKDAFKIKFYTIEQENYFSSLVKGIRRFYNLRLVSLVLFGSMASGENRLNSDCDLLIVLNREDQISRRELLREFNNIELPISELESRMLSSGVTMEVSPVILKRDEALKFNPLYLDMTLNHFVLYDTNAFFAGIMADMKDRMSRWGSKKHAVGNGWYWEIKKDIKYGDRIDYDQ